MFCPKCGIENQIDQRFCRRCGHELAGHRAALENKSIIGLIRLKRAYRTLSRTDRGNEKPLPGSKATAVQLAEGFATDRLNRVKPVPASITEHTTYTLEAGAPTSSEAPSSREVDSTSPAP
jgi:hypothetical protein